MVTFLPQVDRSNTGAQSGRSIGRGLVEGYQQGSEAKRFSEQLRNENEVAKRIGVDLSGITDPKMRQAMVAAKLQGVNQQELELLKQQGKSKILTEKKGLIGNILEKKNSQQNQQQDFQEQGDFQEREQNQNLSQGQFNITQISDDDILGVAALDPTLGREMRMAKDAALKERRFEKEFEFKKELNSPEHRRDTKLSEAQAQADVSYNKELQSSAKQHEIKMQTLDKLEALNKKGITGKPYEKILEKFGLVGLTSDGRREFSADVKNLITDIRSILGGQFSQFEFQTILNAYPSADFSAGANDAIIKNLKEFQEIRKKEFEIANQLKKENKGKLPEDYQSKVNERLEEYTASRLPGIKFNTQKIMNEEYGIKPGFILMFDPQGEPLSVPKDEVEKYQSAGAILP